MKKRLPWPVTGARQELLGSVAPRAASRDRALQITFDFLGSQESEDKKLSEYIIIFILTSVS
jgi:hypothetical protein